ncbi:MAG: hypothetical protein ACOCQD_01075 [archaeon]
MKFTIIGCGFIGSELAYHIARQSHYTEASIELNLMDFDEIEPKNLPFASVLTDHSYLWMNKAMVLKHLCTEVGKKENFTVSYSTDKFDRDIFNMNRYPGSIFIDCRDTSGSSNKTHYKLNFDGSVGKLIVSPKNSDCDGKGNYIFERSFPRMIIFLTQVFWFIVNNTDFSHKQFLLNVEDKEDLPNLTCVYNSSVKENV